MTDENGPRVRLEQRITALETQMRTVVYVGGLVGTIFAGVMILVIVGVLR